MVSYPLQQSVRMNVEGTDSANFARDQRSRPILDPLDLVMKSIG